MLCNFCNSNTAEKQHKIWNRNKGQTKVIELCGTCWNIANAEKIQRTEKKAEEKKNEEKKNEEKKNEEKKNEEKKVEIVKPTIKIKPKRRR